MKYDEMQSIEPFKNQTELTRLMQPQTPQMVLKTPLLQPLKPKKTLDPANLVQHWNLSGQARTEGNEVEKNLSRMTRVASQPPMDGFPTIFWLPSQGWLPSHRWLPSHL